MKVVVLSSHTSSLFWFRMDMMREFVSNGYSVVAIGPDCEQDWVAKFSEYGIEYCSVPVERNGLNPYKYFKTYRAIKKTIKKIRPDKIFLYQAKTIVYGTLAAKQNNIKQIYILIAGLGSIFKGNGVINSIIRKILICQYRSACNASKKVLFQNKDDRNYFFEKKIVKREKTAVINGSGVNLDHFHEVNLPIKTVFLYIGRLIKDKGILEYLEACKSIKQKYPEVRCMLVGPFDTNPSALQKSELNNYTQNGIVEYYGEQTDVRPYIKRCSVFVLPSYHEGTPKAVLEAMAMGRAIITSDAPGCRETVIDNKNGFLVPVKNILILIEKMSFFVENPELAKAMGKESLKYVEQKYDVKKVNKSIMEIMEMI